MESIAHSTPTLHLVREETAKYDTHGGFTMIPDAVRRLNNGYAVGVYEAIARHANQKGECWPTITTICKLTGWSRPHVIKIINLLDEHGVIIKKRRDVNRMNANTLYLIPAKVGQSTSFTAQSTTDTQAVNQKDPGGKPGLLKQEPIEQDSKEQEGDTPLPPTGEKRTRRTSTVKSVVPEDYEPTPEMVAAMVAETGLDEKQIRTETASFRDYHRSKGNRFADLPAAWRSWMRSPYRKQQPRAATAEPARGESRYDDIFAKLRAERDAKQRQEPSNVIDVSFVARGD